MTRPDRRWLIPAALIALSLIPATAGVLRVADLAGVPGPLAGQSRFAAAPFVTMLHAGGSALFLILGATQFAAGPRGRWHRLAGRVAVAAGLAGAAAGIVMTLTFPAEPANGPLLQALRLIFGPLWMLCLLTGLRAALRRDFAAHRLWMARAYAIGLGAGTTVITFGLWYLATGIDTPTTAALAQLAAWTLNLAVAEFGLPRLPNRRPA